MKTATSAIAVYLLATLNGGSALRRRSAGGYRLTGVTEAAAQPAEAAASRAGCGYRLKYAVKARLTADDCSKPRNLCCLKRINLYVVWAE